MTLAATVHLTRAFLAPVTNYTQGVSCGTSGSIGGGGSRSDNFQVSGTFRSYANGVTRVITGSATARVQSLTLRSLTPAQVDLVMAMVGKTCLFRDTYGRRIFGAFLVTSLMDLPLSNGLADIQISIQSVNYTEAV